MGDSDKKLNLGVHPFKKKRTMFACPRFIQPDVEGKFFSQRREIFGSDEQLGTVCKAERIFLNRKILGFGMQRDFTGEVRQRFLISGILEVKMEDQIRSIRNKGCGGGQNYREKKLFHDFFVTSRGTLILPCPQDCETGICG
jgi:hypothetical protein